MPDPTPTIAALAPQASKPSQPYDQESESRRGLVKELTDCIRDARRFWAPVYERMRSDIEFAAGDQWKEAGGSDRYQVNFVQRALNQMVASIYAKNPTFTCERRRRLEYTVWDGSEAALRQAKTVLTQDAQRDLQFTQAGQPAVGPSPEASAIVQDYDRGAKSKALHDKIAETMELLLEYEIDEQSPSFETQMKDAVLREKTTGVAFVSVKFQSEQESVPAANGLQVTVLDRLNAIRALADELMAEQAPDSDPRHETLRLLVAVLQQNLSEGEGNVLRQGLVLDFHPSSAIIVDPKCRSLVEFVGADWIAEQLLLEPEQVRAIWGVDVTGSQCATIQYGPGGETGSVQLRTEAGGLSRERSSGRWPDQARVCVWIMQHKRNGLRYVICDGYEDFLEEPACPWPAVKGFWHTVALKLTRAEVEENKPEAGITCYGQSAVTLLRPMQMEMNRSQEGLREHRIANRPGYLTRKDAFSENDRRALAGRAPHDVIPLDNVPPDLPLERALVAIPTVPIQPALYETATVMQHAMLVTGQQQADLGQQQVNEKATGQAIAEQGRVQSASSEADNQDKCLSTLARICGEMLLLGMDEQVVKRKVGPGAAWPLAMTEREAIREHLYLRVDAGSTGRPNRALEVANLEALMPQLLQLAQGMGLPLDPLVKYAARVMDFDFDIEEWLGQAQGPSMMQPGGQPMPAGPGAPGLPPAGPQPQQQGQPPLPGQVTRMLPPGT